MTCGRLFIPLSWLPGASLPGRMPSSTGSDELDEYENEMMPSNAVVLDVQTVEVEGLNV